MGVRRKRAATGFQYDPDFHASQNVTWPTASGITKDQAEKLCQDKIRAAQAFEKCKSFDTEDFKVEIANCVQDIKLTDNTAWAGEALAHIQEFCSTAIARDPTTWENTDTNKPSLPEVIIKSLCPNDCNGKGTCNAKGQCDCETNYHGYDCTVTEGTAPTVSAAQSNAVCLTTKQTCKKMTIQGMDFKKKSTVCHFTPVNVDETGITWRGKVVTQTAVYNSMSEVMCDLPETRHYLVSVSNGGTFPSTTQALILVHDPTCYQCQTFSDSANGTCSVKESFCRIDGKCYSAKDNHSSDACMLCDPSLSSTQWSRAGDCLVTTVTPDVSRDSQKLMIGIMAGIAAVFFTVIIVLAYVLYVRHKKHNSMSESDHESGPYRRNFDGNYGLRTDKQLSFHNTPVRQLYDPSL